MISIEPGMSFYGSRTTEFFARGQRGMVVAIAGDKAVVLLRDGGAKPIPLSVIHTAGIFAMQVNRAVADAAGDLTTIHELLVDGKIPELTAKHAEGKRHANPR